MSPNGLECEECLIYNCETCFYDLGDGSTSLDFYFLPVDPDTDTATQLCRICTRGYKLSEDKTGCSNDISASLENCDRS